MSERGKGHNMARTLTSMLTSMLTSTLTLTMTMLLSLSALASPRPQFAPRPTFVEPVDVDAAAVAAIAPTEGGVDDEDPADAADDEDVGRGGLSYLLLDRQVRLGARRGDVQRYVHTVRRIDTAEGLELSPLRLHWNPAFETLRIHGLRVRRGGVVDDRTRTARIELLRRERDADRRIYDGALEALVFLGDLRIGDIVDVEVSTVGENPVFGGVYADSFSLGWAAPVAEARLRVVHPVARPLWVAAQGAPAPVRLTTGGDEELLWAANNVARVRPQGDTPTGFSEWPYVELSEDADWASVARWATQLHTLPPPRDPALLAALAEWRALREGAPQANADVDVDRVGEEQIARVLAFVQREIAYVGLEFGEGSHRPSPPDVVFSRRSGDCKDKASLMVALLRALGFRAWPALVNTEGGRFLDQDLPSRRLFDHVIVAVELGGKLLWLDPTRSEESSRPSQIDVGLARALIVADDTTALTAITPPSRPAQEAHLPPLSAVREEWQLAEDGSAVVSVTTTYVDDEADSMRRSFADDSKAEHEKRYTAFYEKSYPGIVSTQPPTGTFTPATPTTRSTFVIREHYRVPDAWTKDEDTRAELLTVVAHTIDDQLWRPSVVMRTVPLGLGAPVRRVHNLTLHMPAGWTIDDHVDTVADSPGVHYERRIRVEGAALHIDHDYEVVVDELPADAAPAFVAALDRVRQLTSYTVQRARTDLPPVEKAWNWALAAIAALTTLLLLLLAVWAWPRARPDAQPAPIRGFAIVLGLVVAARPTWVLVDVQKSVGDYELHRFVALTTPGSDDYHALHAPLLIGELMLNVGMIVAGYWLLALFLGRRARFSWAFLIVGLASVALIFVDGVVSAALAADTPHAYGLAFGRELGLALMRGAFFLPWPLYALASKRGRAIFVR